MAAENDLQRQAQPLVVTAKDETFEAMLKDFPCEACGQYQVRRTERDSWYTCVNCGYSFGIARPKNLLVRAMGSGSSSH